MCATGSGRSALAVSCQESANTDSSPRRDVPTSPVTSTWSPRSMSAFQAASDSSPTRSRESITWSSASPSRRVAKQSLPVLRKKMTRPVTPTFSPVIVSGSRSGCAARTAASVVVRSTVTG